MKFFLLVLFILSVPALGINGAGIDEGTITPAQWEWVSEKPTSSNLQFYIYNKNYKVFLKKTSLVDSNPANATLFTLSATTTCTISYQDEGIKYVYEASGRADWGQNYSKKWTLYSIYGGYYIYHTDPNDGTAIRYIQLNAESVSYPKKDSQAGDGEARLLWFISPTQMSKYVNVSTYERSFETALTYLNEELPENLREQLTTVLNNCSKSLNFNTIDSYINNLNSIINSCKDYLNEATLYTANMLVEAHRYGTFVAPFDVELPEGITAYTASIQASSSSVQLSNTANDGKLSANTPVIVWNNTESTVNLNFDGICSDDNNIDDGVLVGFLKSGVSVPLNAYVLQTQDGGQAFYKVTEETGDLKGVKNRCYLKAQNGNGANAAKAYYFNFEDDETGITLQGEQINVSTSQRIYDLSGRKVSRNNLRPGIYIMDGKKILRK